MCGENIFANNAFHTGNRMWKCFFGLASSTEFQSNLFWNACLLAVALGLRLQKIIIPQYKFRGETAILECDYQLNGKRDTDDDIESSKFNYHDHNDEETLYSVKWYKDGEEFYRFVPKATPVQNSYRGERNFSHWMTPMDELYLSAKILPNPSF